MPGKFNKEKYKNIFFAPFDVSTTTKAFNMRALFYIIAVIQTVIAIEVKLLSHLHIPSGTKADFSVTQSTGFWCPMHSKVMKFSLPTHNPYKINIYQFYQLYTPTHN